MSDLSAAVDRFFDRATGALPTYVPIVPYMIMGAIAGLVVFVLGLIVILEDRSSSSKSTDAVTRYRWLVALGILIAVCTSLSNFVETTAFRIANIKPNTQHIANANWLKVYKNAVM